MENYDRFVEIQNAAMDSEDAGVLQYAKTLDSLESKLNQISNSFQQFYMSIINGPEIGSFLSIINNVITNLSSLPKILSITKVISFVGQIKTVIQMVFNMISSGMSKISTSSREWRQTITGESVTWAERLGQTIANAIANGINQNRNQISGAIGGAATGTPTSQPGKKTSNGLAQGLYAGGALLTAAGLAIPQTTDAGYGLSTATSALGGAATTAAMIIGHNYVGAAIQGLTTIFELVSRIVNASEAKIERLSQQLEKDNVQRAEDKNNAKTLAEYIDKEQELRAARYDSAEAMQKYLDVSNEIAEKYPQFISYIDESGNAIVNMGSATEYLKQALDAAAKSSKDWGKTAIELAEEELQKAYKDARYDNATPSLIKNTVKGTFFSSGMLTPGMVSLLGFDEDSEIYKILNNIADFDYSTLPDGFALRDKTYDERMDILEQITGTTAGKLLEYVNTFKLQSKDDSLTKSNQARAENYLQALVSIFRGLFGYNSLLENGQGSYEFADFAQKQQALDNVKSQALSSNIYSVSQQYMLGKDNKEKQWAQDNNATAYITSMAGQKALDSGDAKTYIENFSEEEYKSLFEHLKEVFAALDQDMLEAFNEKPESISMEQLNKMVEGADGDVQNAIISRWVDSDSAAFVALAKAMGDDELLSYSEYLTKNNLEDSQESKRSYYDVLKGVRSGLVKQLDATTAQTAANYLQDFQKITEDSSLPQSQRTAAQNMSGLLQEALDVINNSITDATTKDKLINALFSDDIGSYGWAQNVESLFSEAGIALNENVLSAVYMGLDAMLDDAVSQATSAMSLLEEVSGKQSSGMSYEDASNYARKLDMEGSIFDNFNVKDGKYYFNDYNEVQAKYIEQQRAILKQEQAAIEQARNIKSGRISDDDGKTFYNGPSVWDTINSIESGGVKDAAIQWYNSVDATEQTIENLQSWLSERAQEAEDAAKALDELKSRLTKDSNISNLKKSIDGAKINLTADVFNKDWWAQFGDGDTSWIEQSFTVGDIKKHLEGTGYVFDAITGQVSRTMEAIKQDLEASSEEDERAHYLAELESKKEELTDAISDYTGVITQEQINFLREQNADTSGLVSGEKWSRDLVTALFPDLSDLAGSKWDSAIEEQVDSVKSSMEKVLTSMVKGEDVLTNDVVEVWESITGREAGSAQRSIIEQAMSQGWQAVAALLQNAIKNSSMANEFAGELADILASVIDAIRSSVNSAVSSIKSGFSGSLSRANIQEIAKQTGLSEEQLLRGATQSLSGYQLDQDALLQLAGATSGKYGYNYDIAKTLVDEGVVKSYEDINRLLAEVGSETAKWGDQTEQVVKILNTAKGIMESSVSNDSWFNPDYYDTIDDKFQDYLDKVTKGSSLLQSIQKGERISRSDSEFMAQVVSQSESFQKALAANKKSVDDFYAALANHTDITTGKQDFAAALSDIGMSFEDFGNNFAESVSSFADTRIAQLEAMKAMLLSQEQFADAMEDLSNNKVDLFDGLKEGTNPDDAANIIRENLDNVESQINTIVAEKYGEGSTHESVYGISFTNMMLQTMGLTPEGMASMTPAQQSQVNKGVQAFMGFYSQALNNPDNWVANDPVASFAKIMGQLSTLWQEYAIDNNLDWGINVDIKVDDLRKEVQSKIADLNESLAGMGIKLKNIDLNSVTDPEKLQKLSAAADSLKTAMQSGDASALQTAVNGFNQVADAAENTGQTTEEALKQAQEQVEELSKQLASLEKTYTARVNANTSAARSAVQTLISSINSMTATIKVNANVNSSSIKDTIKNTGKVSTTSSLKKPSTTDKYINRVYYTGNANGLALYNGTKIAGKTLVGELGPEMAVYDNAYHILGQDGAEFVNLPDDAIVFNHKQTAGIINGQAGYRGKTVNGGPAFAKGSLAAAIAAIDKEIALWKSMKDLTLSDMLGGSGGSGGGGGGGSGNTLKAHIEDLVEWYNLSRQIADIEQKINNIIAERENITDGHEYLRSLREQQHLLEGQVLTQRTLLGYQQKQLELQAEQINTNPIWSKFFEVDANGLLQYVMGNEVNGGKGTLSVLQQLNQMSGEQQLAYIKGTGYSYIDNDGNVLDGEELIAQFYTEAQEQIDKYDELRDTVEETDEALSKLQTSIDEIEQEIRKNQEDLEQAIYDSIVSAWEKQISDLTEQMNLLKEANDAYVNGLSDALAKEKNLYSQNQSTADREQLQRQLSLLRRAGGSASQIADLEEQLNDSLKNEYFSHQQDSIDSIKEANQKQIDALNKQIKIQQETLDFQKENGVLWSKVYEILARSDNEILEFLKGNNSDFFSKSALVQRDMLEEWAKQIGIYKENNDVGYIGNINTANENFVAEAWNSAKGADKQKMFNVLDKTTQAMLQDYFASAFANAKLQGMGSEDAYEYARNDMYQKLYQAYNQKINADSRNLADARANSQPTVSPSGGGSGGDYGSGGGGSGGGYSGGGSSTSRISITVSAGNTGGYPTLASSGGGTSASVSAGTRVVIAPNAKNGYAFDYITYNGTKKSSMSIVPTGNVSSISIRVFYKRTGSTKGIGGSPSGDADHRVLTAASGAFVNRDNQPALLHKGEGVFTAQQTSALISLVDNYQKLASGNISASLIASLSGATRNYSNINARNNAASSVVVNPGAVVIQVDQLNDKYDVDDLATDVFNKITTIASKATNRGVNRR